MTFDPTSVEVTCVTLPKDHCIQVSWEYINVCGYRDQFCKILTKFTTYYELHTCSTSYYLLYTYMHTTYRMSDHMVSFEQSSGETKSSGKTKTAYLASSVPLGPGKYVARFDCFEQWFVAKSPSLYAILLLLQPEPAAGQSGYERSVQILKKRWR